MNLLAEHVSLLSTCRGRAGAVFRALGIAVALFGAGCGETIELGLDAGLDASALKSNGETCGGGTECTNGHCVDGICCESACTGVCEACNVAGQLGTCAAVAMGQDPAMECMPKLVVDVDGGAQDGGVVLNLPDAGLNTMEPPCAPKCDGKRACGFPDATVACGDTFCNSSTEAGGAVCDGEGHCSVQVTDCVAYSCGPKACKTSCVANTDCLDTHFCNASGACQEKKALGISCGSNPSECASGFCADGVCCNADCGSISGGKCNNVGAVGICKCTIQPGNKICDGTCEYYYLDGDGDGQGKASSSIVGCTGDPNNDPAPPVGYVRNATDCADDDARVHVGAGLSTATNWISAYQPSYDWNCDGVVTKEHPYRGGAVCRYCNPRSTSLFIGGASCGGTSTTSGVANEYSYIYCGQSECSGSKPTACLSRCCGQGCSNQGAFGYNSWAFVSGGSACGTSGTLRWCQMGAGAGSGVPASVDFSGTQACQ